MDKLIRVNHNGNESILRFDRMNHFTLNEYSVTFFLDAWFIEVQEPQELTQEKILEFYWDDNTELIIKWQSLTFNLAI